MARVTQRNRTTGPPQRRPVAGSAGEGAGNVPIGRGKEQGRSIVAQPQAVVDADPGIHGKRREVLPGRDVGSSIGEDHRRRPTNGGKRPDELILSEEPGDTVRGVDQTSPVPPLGGLTGGTHHHGQIADWLKVMTAVERIVHAIHDAKGV